MAQAHSTTVCLNMMLLALLVGISCQKRRKYFPVGSGKIVRDFDGFAKRYLSAMLVAPVLSNKCGEMVAKASRAVLAVPPRNPPCSIICGICPAQFLSAE